jgi:hypothetical protein
MDDANRGGATGFSVRKRARRLVASDLAAR